MKRPNTIVSTVSRARGLGILAATVAFAAVWLYLQGGEAALQASTKQSLPSMKAPVDEARFDTDAWYLPKETLLGFVEIPAGAFIMGSDPAADAMTFDNELWPARKQGSVDLAAFYMSRYEVTVAQFRAFIEATGYRADQQALIGYPDYPVVNVSWTDAVAYSRWLTDQLKQSAHTPASLAQRLRDGWIIAIPTEAQWEKAARSTDGRIFPWGNVASREYANYASTSTTSVGHFACPKCAFDLADMSGNVWEFTRSVYKPYPFNTVNDTSDLQSDALFVMRGGSFNDTDRTIRAAVRGGVDPGVRREFIGFRVVLARP